MLYPIYNFQTKKALSYTFYACMNIGPTHCFLVHAKISSSNYKIGKKWYKYIPHWKMRWMMFAGLGNFPNLQDHQWSMYSNFRILGKRMKESWIIHLGYRHAPVNIVNTLQWGKRQWHGCWFVSCNKYEVISDLIFSIISKFKYEEWFNEMQQNLFSHLWKWNWHCWG